VEWYLRGFSRRYDIKTELVRKGMDARLAPELETSAYRIVQEALTNVAKHACATICRVHMERSADRVAITIEDDGVGFDPVPAGHHVRPGLGLVGIRERAIQLQGEATVDSGTGRGTRLVVAFPARLRQAVVHG
jgi:signal transduction histidine kinase